MTPIEIAHWLEREGATCQRHIDASVLIRTQEATITRLTECLHLAWRESEEQSRLLGMSGEREALLIGKLELKDRELKKALNPDIYERGTR